MRIDRSFDWLGRFPLAIDLADTVRLIQGKEVELLTDEETLATWVDIELPRFPLAKAALGRLPDVHELRDAVRRVLLAHASGSPLPHDDMELLNAASERAPSYQIIDERGNRTIVETSDEDFDVFRAQVARSSFEILHQEHPTVAVCHAPSCGMLFVPGNRRQHWCSTRCGNRARVARHSARNAR
jgi:predicted RNA-binding Zn ribbon-like protein